MKIFLYITDAGSGHRRAAQALTAAAEEAGLGWDLRTLNVYRQLWPGHDPLKRRLGFFAEDAYNFVLRRNLLWLTPAMRWAALAASGRPAPGAERALAEFLEAERPDLCVSLMPFVNDLFARVHARMKLPLGLVCTDLADRRPYMWFTPAACATAAFVCAGSAEAAEQAAGAGAAGGVVLSGLPIHPRFFRGLPSRAEAAGRLGLDPSLFTVALHMGGQGGRAIREIVGVLEGSRRRLQVLALCGRDQGVLAELERMKPGLGNRLLALGFVEDMPALLCAADLLISKPGPASIMEALALRLPLLLDARQPMPQEAPNAAWVEAKGFGLAARRRADFLPALEGLTQDPARLESLRRAQAAFPLPKATDAILRAMRACRSASTPS